MVFGGIGLEFYCFFRGLDACFGSRAGLALVTYFNGDFSQIGLRQSQAVLRFSALRLLVGRGAGLVCYLLEFPSVLTVPGLIQIGAMNEDGKKYEECGMG